MSRYAPSMSPAPSGLRRRHARSEAADTDVETRSRAGEEMSRYAPSAPRTSPAPSRFPSEAPSMPPEHLATEASGRKELNKMRDMIRAEESRKKTKEREEAARLVAEEE